MLTLQDFVAAKGFSLEQISAFGVRQGPRGVEIPYFDTDGSERPRVRVRTALAAKDGSTWSEGSAALVPYGLHRPVEWEKRYVFIVEGETDCWTLWGAGKPAIGIPGAQMTKCLEIDHVDGADTIYVIQEPGEAGERFPHRVAARLYSRGFAGDVFAVQLGDAKDPHELWIRDPEQFGSSLFKALAERAIVPRPAVTPKAAKPAGRDVTSLSALFSKPRERARYLIDGMLPENGVMLCTAKPKAGKSELVRNIARAVVTGGEFLGRPCKQGKVVWIRLEEPFDNFLDSLQTMGFADHADQFLTNEDIPEAELIPWLSDIADRHKPALVVIDTWHKLTRVKDINSYADVNLANEPLMRLREKGVAQIWIHHSNKGLGGAGDSVLGSSALFAACDTLLSIRREQNDSRVVQTVQRVGADFPDTIVEMNPETREITVAMSRAQHRLGIVEQEVLEFLNDRPNGAAMKSELADGLNRRKADTLAAIDNLEDRRMVVVDRNPTNVNGHLVSLRTTKAESRELGELPEPTTVPSSEPFGNRSELREPRELQLTVPVSSGGSSSSREFPSSVSSWSSHRFPSVPTQFPARFGALGNAYVSVGALACDAAASSRRGAPLRGSLPSSRNRYDSTRLSSPKNSFRQIVVPAVAVAAVADVALGARSPNPSTWGPAARTAAARWGLA